MNLSSLYRHFLSSGSPSIYSWVRNTSCRLDNPGLQIRCQMRVEVRGEIHRIAAGCFVTISY